MFTQQIMELDVEKNIGVAISDTNAIIATGIEVIKVDKIEKSISALKKIINIYQQ